MRCYPAQRNALVALRCTSHSRGNIIMSSKYWVMSWDRETIGHRLEPRHIIFILQSYWCRLICKLGIVIIPSGHIWMGIDVSPVPIDFIFIMDLWYSYQTFKAAKSHSLFSALCFATVQINHFTSRYLFWDACCGSCRMERSDVDSVASNFYGRHVAWRETCRNRQQEASFKQTLHSPQHHHHGNSKGS